MVDRPILAVTSAEEWSLHDLVQKVAEIHRRRIEEERQARVQYQRIVRYYHAAIAQDCGVLCIGEDLLTCKFEVSKLIPAGRIMLVSPPRGS